MHPLLKNWIWAAIFPTGYRDENAIYHATWTRTVNLSIPMLHGWVDRERKADVQETLAIRCRRMDRIFNFVERRPSRYDRIDKRIRENWYRHSEMKMDPETRRNTGGQNAALLRKLNLPTGLMKIVWFDKYTLVRTMSASMQFIIDRVNVYILRFLSFCV